MFGVSAFWRIFASSKGQKDNYLRITNLKERKKIMVTLLIFAVIAISIAKAVNLGHQIDLQK